MTDGQMLFGMSMMLVCLGMLAAIWIRSAVEDVMDWFQNQFNGICRLQDRGFERLERHLIEHIDDRADSTLFWLRKNRRHPYQCIPKGTRR